MNTRMNKSGVLAVLVGAATLLTACPDDSANMAQAIQQQASARATTPPPPAADGLSGGQGLNMPAETPGGQQTPVPTPGPGAVNVGGLPQAADPAAATEDTESKQKITVTVNEIRPPAPRYEDKGRYDLSFEVAVDPPIDEAVWRIMALDEQGNIVGEQEQMLLLLHERPKQFQIKAFYCLSKPSSISMEIALNKDGTPKVAVKADDNSGQNSVAASGGGGGGGGGTSAPGGPGLAGGAGDGGGIDDDD